MKTTFPVSTTERDIYKLKTPSNLEVSLPGGLLSHAQFTFLQQDGILDEQGDVHDLPPVAGQHLLYLVSTAIKEARNKDLRLDKKTDLALVDSLKRCHEIILQSIGKNICVELYKIEEGGHSNKRPIG